MDASVYAWNREAVHTLKKMGPEFITMPWELNSRELKAVTKACEKENLADELILYGHAPMMVSAQCVVKTLKGSIGSAFGSSLPAVQYAQSAIASHVFLFPDFPGSVLLFQMG